MNKLNSTTQQKIELTENYLNRINSADLRNRDILQACVQSIFIQIAHTNLEQVKSLGERFIVLCQKNKVKSPLVNELDRVLHADENENNFLISENIKNFSRWQKWGFGKDDFVNHYKSVKYLLESPLGNQLKIFENPLIELNNQLGILVEGSWVSIEEIENRFEIKYLPEFREKFMVHKQSGEVYTYLGNGKGLQEHNPYTEMTLEHPITSLSEEEYNEVLASARNFLRKGETHPDPERTYILQIVSSYVTDSWNNNVMEWLYRRKHPYMRVVCGSDNQEYKTKKGDVFEIGFGWNAPSLFPGKTIKGRFRTEDLWNYNTKAKKRYVTNIPISQDEAQNMLKYILEFHLNNICASRKTDRIAFNLWAQNCSAFIHYIAKQADVDVPTKIYLKDLLVRISPDSLKFVGNRLSEVYSKTKKIAACIFPKLICVPFTWALEIMKKLGEKIGLFIISPPVTAVSMAVGGASGDEGRAFTDKAHEKKVLGVRIGQKEKYYHLPGLLQEWQINQASTVVYHNPVKLTVVPPKA